MKKKVFFTTIVALTSISAWASLSSVQVNYNEMNILSAFSVFTKQEAVSSSQKSSMVHNSIQQLATAIGAIGMSERMKESLINFNSSTGQPKSVSCDAQTTNNRTVVTRSQQSEDTAVLTEWASTFPARTPIEKDAELIKGHKSAYCSISENVQGMCKIVPNGMQSWDVDYSKAFNQKTVSDDGYYATFAFAKNITNFTSGTDESECKSGDSDCIAAEYNNLEPLSESSMVTAIIVDQGNAKRQPFLKSKKESQ